MRKLVYTGTVDLIVTDFDTARKQVVALAEQNGGYVANFNVDAASGDRRRASYTVRVPVAKFLASMDTFAALGHVITTNTNSQDVTDEYYDLEARLKTKHEEEKSLRELLAKSTDKLENLLAIRKELTRIREEIESAQGRLNKLSKLTEMTTITVTMQERKDYTPPTAPTFASQVGETFSSSTTALGRFLRTVALVVVALAPWLPFILVAIGVLIFVVRRSNRIVVPAPELPAAVAANQPPSSSD